MNKKKITSLLQLYGYTRRDFKRWGKLGGRFCRYETNAERQKAYRLRKKLTSLPNFPPKPWQDLTLVVGNQEAL